MTHLVLHDNKFSDTPGVNLDLVFAVKMHAIIYCLCVLFILLLEIQA